MNEGAEKCVCIVLSAWEFRKVIQLYVTDLRDGATSQFTVIFFGVVAPPELRFALKEAGSLPAPSPLLGSRCEPPR
jgi:hypothetical protein